MMSAIPSSIAARSHRLLSCSAMGMRGAVGGRAGAIAGVHQEHQGQQASHFAVVRQCLMQRPGKADGFLCEFQAQELGP